jgi:hypothetical protein
MNSVRSRLMAKTRGEGGSKPPANRVANLSVKRVILSSAGLALSSDTRAAIV